MGISPAPPEAPPRRSTRLTLSRFAYQGPTSISSTSIVDIEDAAVSNVRKRRRVATAESDGIAAKAESAAADLQDDTTSTVPKAESPTATPRKRRKPARVVRGASPSALKVEPPTDWEEMYNLIREMRLTGPARNAAVDTMGCERLFSPTASERDKRFHILIALMLSSQTKDTVNAVAMARLHSELPPYEAGAPVGLNLENILAVDPTQLNGLIRQVGFHNNKTKYIKAAAMILRDEHDSDVPQTIQGLVALPGVGPKMGHLCLSAAWGKTEGIGVDVHVHRLTNLWGWHKTNNPEASRLALEAWLPRDRWYEINTLLVGLGQTVCPPQAGSRRCGECTLGLQGLCRGADRRKVAEGRKVAAALGEAKAEVGDNIKRETNGDAEAKTAISRHQDVSVKAEEME